MRIIGKDGIKTMNYQKVSCHKGLNWQAFINEENKTEIENFLKGIPCKNSRERPTHRMGYPARSALPCD